MQRIIGIVVVLLGLAAIGFGSDPIKIGVVMNLTGPWASIDGPAWNVIQLAVDQINAAGGILGQPVEAICIDTKADEAETIAAVTRLVETEKVSAILGYGDTHWVLTGAPLLPSMGYLSSPPGQPIHGSPNAPGLGSPASVTTPKQQLWLNMLTKSSACAKSPFGWTRPMTSALP